MGSVEPVDWLDEEPNRDSKKAGDRPASSLHQIKSQVARMKNQT
jgi:hypothetical protein